MRPIPFLRPTFPPTEQIAEDYEGIVASGTYANGGPKERDLRAAIAAWIGRGVTVSLTSSGTAALQLAGAACFLPAPRFVLVPSFTFPAGPLAIRWCGYEPLFIDVDPVTWQPDLRSAEPVLQREVADIAGILLTMTFGVGDPAVEDWEALAAERGVPLVIDMAAGLGSSYSPDERAGARGACEVFSLHATKTVAVGEGGAVASRDHGLIERIDRMKNFGFDDARRVVEFGTNAKLTELASAIGLRQLAVLTDRLELRRAVFEAYVRELEPLGARFQPTAPLSALPFVSAVLPDGALRDRLVAALASARIECRTYYNPPVHRHPFFSEARCADALTVTDDICRRVISLPMADDLSPEAIRRIGEGLREVLGRG